MNAPIPRLSSAEYEVVEGVRPIYFAEAKLTFVGPPVDGFNRAAPEIGAAVAAAIDAATDALRAHGFEIARTGYGSYRLPNGEPERGPFV